MERVEHEWSMRTRTKNGACGLELSGQLPTNLLEETQHHDIEEDNEDNDDEIDSLLCREEAMPEVSVSLSQ